MARSILGYTKWITRIAWMIAALLPNSLSVDIDRLGDRANLVLDAQSWALWALVLVALWVPHPIALTTARMLSPLVALIMGARLVGSEWSPSAILATLFAVAVCMFIFTAEFGSEQVQAGAFGNERRFVLKLPAPLVLPVILGWLLFAVAMLVAPIAVATSSWMISVPTAAVALVILWFAPQRLHQLSRRWLVRVPAGWVIHDSVLLADNVLVRTHEMQAMTIASSDSQAFDITGLTSGLALEIALREPTTVRLTPFAAQISKTLDVVHAKALRVAPSRAQNPLTNQ